MLKAIVLAAAAASTVAGAARGEPWKVESGADRFCYAQLHMAANGQSAGVITLVSDGAGVGMLIYATGLPTHAFVPLVVDGTPHSELLATNLKMPGWGFLSLSPETTEAVAHGTTLALPWMAHGHAQTSLDGASQGIADLRRCGAGMEGVYREKAAETARADQQAAAAAQAAAQASAEEAARREQRRQAWMRLFAGMQAAGAAMQGASRAASPAAADPATGVTNPFHTYVINGQTETCVSGPIITSCN